MGKRKISNISKECSSGSDDMNNSSIGHNSKKSLLEVNHGVINKKMKALGKKTLIKDELSSDSELEYDNLKIPKQTIENLQVELCKKRLSKRKREEVSTSEDSAAGETVSSNSKFSSNNSKLKLSKKEKRNESPKKDANIANKSTSEDSESDDDNENEQVHMIKKEILSDDANSKIASNRNGISMYSKSKDRIKQEARTSSDSDSDRDKQILDTPEHHIQSLTEKSSSVTILQDVRFTPKSPNEKLKELYPGLKSIGTNELNLSDSDEIYMFRMPKNVDPHLLKNIELDLESKCKIKLGEKYVVAPTNKVPGPTLVIGVNSRVLQFKNNIKMEKYIKSKAEPTISIPQKETVPLPDKLKNRHPLFGSDFQEKIVLSEDVEEQLGLAVQNLLKRQKKSKKRKEKKRMHLDSSEKPNQDILNLFNFHMKKETSDDSAFGSSSSVDRPRGKKNIGEEAEFATDALQHKSPKKKKRRSEDISSLGVSNIKHEFQDDFETYENHFSRVNSTLMSDILKTPKFNPEISTIQSNASTSGKRPKKSKSDRKSKEDSSEKKEKLISDLINEATVQMNNSKKFKVEF